MTDPLIAAAGGILIVALAFALAGVIHWRARRRKDPPAKAAQKAQPKEPLLDARDYVLGVALLLIAGGFWQFWTPGAMLAPGLILLVLAVGRR